MSKSDTEKAIAPVPEPSAPAAKKIKLTEAQGRLLDVLRDAASLKMSVAQICSKAKVSRQTYYDSFDSDNFSRALEAAIQTHLRASEFRVLHNITEKAANPKVNSHHWAMMVERMRGRLEEQSRKPALVQVVFNGVQRPKVDIEPGKIIVGEVVEEEDAD